VSLRLLKTFSVFALVAAALAASAPFAAADDQPDTLTADEILASASQRLAATPTIRFKLQVEGDTYIDSLHTLQLIEADGDLVRPDRVRTEFKIKALGRATVTIQMIIIGNQWWTTDLITGKWGPAPGEFEYDPSVLFDNQGGIGPVMDHVQNAKRLDDEKVNGRQAFHLQAVVDESVIGPLTYNTMEGSPITVDLWIDKETDDLLRARLAEPPREGPDKPAVWTLDLSHHGDKISIDPPS
jgi:LppX_LprAFG lipoprotein